MTHHRGKLYSINAMLLAVFMFSLMDGCMKLLAARYPAIQVTALRALTSLPLVAIYLAWRGAYAGIFRVRWSMHVLRGVLGIGMLALFAFGLARLSLAEAYAIFFISPAFITVLSVLLLKERVSGARWLAVGAGLVGVLVVLRPSADGLLTVGALAVLAAAACYGVSAVTVRMLARSDRSEHTVFWMIVMIAIGAGILAAPVWVALSMADAPVLAMLAVTGFVGQIALTEAFSHGDASRIAPLEYTALAWGVGLDWILWSALPDLLTLVGAGIIIGSGIYLIRHEKQAA